MARTSLLMLLALLVVTPFSGAWATEIPIERDLRGERAVERRLGEAPDLVDNPNASPANPEGVVGFDGPPNDGISAVDTGGPLPPGSISNRND